MYENYIFDLYGTLVDIRTNENKPYLWKKMALMFCMHNAKYTYTELRARYRELVLQEQERTLEMSRQAFCDDTISISDIEIQLETVFEKLFLERGVEPDSQQILDTAVFFRTLSLEHIELFEGARELLDRLHQAGKQIYLLSNAQRIFTEPEMKMLGIYDCFDRILYSSDTGMQKPHTLFYESLFKLYCLKKENSVMIGNDRTADIEGAYRFGIDSMYVHTEQSTPFSGNLPANCRRLQTIGDAYPSS